MNKNICQHYNKKLVYGTHTKTHKAKGHTTNQKTQPTKDTPQTRRRNPQNSYNEPKKKK